MKKLTKYTPEKTFTIEKNGFHGTGLWGYDEVFEGRVEIKGLTYTGIQIRNEFWNSYDDMNAKILERI